MTAAGADPQFIAALRGDMLRFARLQLGQDDEAEDAVQEALAGALRNADRFNGQVALKTWVIAILRNKIADILRQRHRRPLLGSDAPNDDDHSSSLFDHRGMWREADRPSAWENPESGLHSRQFHVAFDACLNRLPPQQGRVFLMREVVELGTGEICAELGISVSNVHVLLHRARLSLRSCLERNWFHEGSDPC